MKVRINEQGKREVFDPVRRLFVALTPEEDVRQRLISYFHEIKHVPFSLMGVEKKIIVNGLAKRPDIIIFNRNAHTVLIAECKAPSVKLSEDVVDQIVRYNMTLRADYLLITNGEMMFCFDCTGTVPEMIDINTWKFEI